MLRICRESGGNGVKVGFEFEVVLVRFGARRAARASVKQDATRCMESPRGVTTRLRWWRYLLADMYSSFATDSAQARRRCTSCSPVSCPCDVCIYCSWN